MSGRLIEFQILLAEIPLSVQMKIAKSGTFLSVESEITVKLLNTEEMISGNFKMPFSNNISGKNVQKEDNNLHSAYSYLSSGS